MVKPLLLIYVFTSDDEHGDDESRMIIILRTPPPLLNLIPSRPSQVVNIITAAGWIKWFNSVIQTIPFTKEM